MDIFLSVFVAAGGGFLLGFVIRYWLAHRAVVCHIEEFTRKGDFMLENRLAAVARQLGRRAVPHLAAALSHPDRNVRSAAAKTLGQLRGLAQGALKQLQRLVESDSNEWVRHEASVALQVIGADLRDSNVVSEARKAEAAKNAEEWEDIRAWQARCQHDWDPFFRSSSCDDETFEGVKCRKCGKIREHKRSP